MLVRNWMTGDITTVTAETPILKTSVILRQNNIRRAPVTDSNGDLVGIVTDRDVKEATPSKATSLDIYELNYLLASVKTREVMTPEPICVKPDETVELAAALMMENKISGLPVIDDDGHIAGIITESDVFRALINMSGIMKSGRQFALELEDTPGSLREVADVIRDAGGRLSTLISKYPPKGEGMRNVFIHVCPDEPSVIGKITEALNKKYKLLYTIDDALGELKKRRKKPKPG